MPRALIVDDDPVIHRIMERVLRERGCATQVAFSGELGLVEARASRPDLILLDIHMEGMGGLETLRRLGRELPDTPVVIMTGEGSIALAVEAFKSGAVDFVTKPFDRPKLLSAIDACLAGRSASAGGEAGASPIIGDSPALREALDLVRRFARPDINILLQGETGTGKELFAQAIHAASKRKDGPFVAVDCAYLSASLVESELFGHEKHAFTGADRQRIGRFEKANGGTLFLDEVGNLPLDLQSKLLRVLQQRTIERVGGSETIQLDIRIISAANVKLQDRIVEGRFKQDLFFRLAEATICPPPLRERVGDIARLATFFAQKYGQKYAGAARGVAPDALARLEAHSFEGNVRELENLIKSAVVRAGDDELLRAEHLPRELGGGGSGPASSGQPTLRAPLSTRGTSPAGGKVLSLEVTLDDDNLDLRAIGASACEQAEAQAIGYVLGSGKRSVADLARIMKVDVKTMKSKLAKYGLR